ncbi:prolipoprotein diacylglyceryl transferase [Brevibacterium sanguinis]|uniref:Phosphatidylglycerol--prolipoprotein diacylglyceryl transferase n=2 Tax=Brevibacterium TaxID=1696 RepID=A0A366IHQ3_9MICO|nr:MULTISPECIES: prolipoprotein diacylglyceryl transferase [Brevibacterium]RBP61611.1 prolipoprotein diacylglyceryl transferase [Brevibacterium sanguinis]RBP70863.1 prolipoprotein diacylglyceryl transferase [Brevibacterium celere]
MSDLLAAIPSPSWSGFHIGPLTIHAYALCILTGIVLALWLTSRRWQARGGHEDDLWTIAIITVPAGIIGGRLYHIFSTPDPYFGPDGNPIDALKIWNGGLGIWGAVALGMLAAWAVARHQGIRILPFLDAAAPGLILAQAVGRWGNWFNQELFGAPTTLPWGLEIDKHVNGVLNPNWPDPDLPATTLFHPTFLYESLWNLLGCVILVVAARRFRLGHGQVFALYICYYTLGRVWIEALRIDDAELVLGLRLNIWTSILVFAAGLIWFVVSRLRHREPETEIYLPGARALRDRDDDQRPGDSPGAGPRATDSSGAAPGPESHGPTPATPTGDGRPDEDRRPGFGFFGAVTSAISIIPDVGRRNRDDRRNQG